MAVVTAIVLQYNYYEYYVYIIAVLYVRTSAECGVRAFFFHRCFITLKRMRVRNSGEFLSRVTYSPAHHCPTTNNRYPADRDYTLRGRVLAPNHCPSNRIPPPQRTRRGVTRLMVVRESGCRPARGVGSRINDKNKIPRDGACVCVPLQEGRSRTAVRVIRHAPAAEPGSRDRDVFIGPRSRSSEVGSAADSYDNTHAHAHDLCEAHAHYPFPGPYRFADDRRSRATSLATTAAVLYVCPTCECECV